MYGQVPGSSLGYISDWTYNLSLSRSLSYLLSRHSYLSSLSFSFFLVVLHGFRVRRLGLRNVSHVVDPGFFFVGPGFFWEAFFWIRLLSNNYLCQGSVSIISINVKGVYHLYPLVEKQDIRTNKWLKDIIMNLLTWNKDYNNQKKKENWKIFSIY